MTTSNISVIYEKAKQYQIHAATGVYGGVNPQGELICNFFIEQESLPNNIFLEVNNETGTVQENTQENKKHFVREIQCAIVIRPDIAKAIGEWLIKNSENFSIELKK